VNSCLLGRGRFEAWGAFNSEDSVPLGGLPDRTLEETEKLAEISRRLEITREEMAQR